MNQFLLIPSTFNINQYSQKLLKIVDTVSEVFYLNNDSICLDQEYVANITKDKNWSEKLTKNVLEKFHFGNQLGYVLKPEHLYEMPVAIPITEKSLLEKSFISTKNINWGYVIERLNNLFKIDIIIDETIEDNNYLIEYINKCKSIKLSKDDTYLYNVYMYYIRNFFINKKELSNNSVLLDILLGKIIINDDNHV